MKNALLHETSKARNRRRSEQPAASMCRSGVTGSCSWDRCEEDLRGISKPQEFTLMSTPITTASNTSVESLLERFIAPLFAGDRSGARAIVAEAFEEGLSAE